jgi:hypothetical protein
MEISRLSSVGDEDKRFRLTSDFLSHRCNMEKPFEDKLFLLSTKPHSLFIKFLDS